MVTDKGGKVGKNESGTGGQDHGDGHGPAADAAGMNTMTGMSGEGFYTMKGYERATREELTSSMEDYLEMVCRMEEEGYPIRVSSLAASLHVRPSSASKMLNNLKRAGYIDFKKYGSIMVTEKGYGEGRYLLHRHRVLHDFFCVLNHSENELELVEKIEHFINQETVENMERALSLLRHMDGDDITGNMG